MTRCRAAAPTRRVSLSLLYLFLFRKRDGRFVETYKSLFLPKLFGKFRISSYFCKINNYDYFSTTNKVFARVIYLCSNN